MKMIKECVRCGDSFKNEDPAEEYCDVCVDLIAETGEIPKI